MATLYVTEAGARVEKEYRRLLVTKEEEVLLSVPLSQVTNLVLVGWVGVTTPAMLALLDAGVGLSLVTRSGRLRGRLCPPASYNLLLRQMQYSRDKDAKFCLEIGRSIVIGKITNSRTWARRMLRQRRNRDKLSIRTAGDQAIRSLNQSLAKVAQAGSLDEIRGLEGASSREYFRVLRLLLGENFTFDKRTRRPPEDPTNALLSLTYSLLTQALISACEIAGLDPYQGYFHADKYGRPALALDLVEEFRSIIADSVVLTLISNRIVRLKDFTESGEEKGIYLSPKGLRRVLSQFSKRLNAAAYHPIAGKSMSYQKILEIQARQLRKVIEGQSERYTPFIAR